MVTSGEIRILVAGGGTAGHVSPGLAILDALSQRFAASKGALALTARWMGSSRIEAQIVPAAGVSFSEIDIRFSYRVPVPRNWGYYRQHILPLALGRPFSQALSVLRTFAPHVVIGTGGYVAAPALWAAGRLGIPYALIQLDAKPGLVNWHFAPDAWRVYASTPRVAQAFAGRVSLSKLRVHGFPVQRVRRSRSIVLSELGIDPSRRVLLAMGGSLGAGAVHRAVRELLFAAARDRDPRWSQLSVLSIGGEREHLAGDLLNPGVLPAGPMTCHHTGYFPHAIDAVAAADFYVGRSGAASVGELIAQGPPALLVPDPQHADRQQYANAELLVERGQGTVVDQREVSGAGLLAWLRDVWNQPRCLPPQPPAAQAIAADLACLWESE